MATPTLLRQKMGKNIFLENKYTQWYLKIINAAKEQNRKRLKRNNPGFLYYEKHHIIPQCMGGTETVLLTAKEHYICHLLLCKMTEHSNKHKMIDALIKMAYNKGKGQQRYTARSFDLIRKFIAQKNSERFKGKKKSAAVRANMKGRSGKWVRTEEYRNKVSKQRKGMVSTFKGKKHSEQTKALYKKQRAGKTIGKRFYTNGIIDKLCYPDQAPEGFWLGLTNTKWRQQNAC